MAVAATGSISLAEDAAMNLLANIAAVRTFFGVATVPLAKAKLFNDEVASTAVRPYGLVFMDPEGPGFEMNSVAEGPDYTWSDTGEVRVILERIVPAAHAASVADAERDFKNHLGAIVDGIRELSGSGSIAGILNVVRLRLFGPWRFTEDYEESALGKIQVAGMLLNWEA